MKTILKGLVLIATILTFSSHKTYAQTSIGGIYLEKTYTKSQIVSILGSPTYFDDTPDDFGDVGLTYKYSHDEFYFIKSKTNNDKWLITDFDIKNNSKFKINGIVSIGDNVSKIDLLPNAKKKIIDLDGITYIYSVSDEPDMLFAASIEIYTRNSIIYQIMYTAL